MCSKGLQQLYWHVQAAKCSVLLREDRCTGDALCGYGSLDMGNCIQAMVP